MVSDKEPLEKAIDSVVGMILFDRSGRIIGSNEVFRTITGYTTEEIRSGKLTWRTLTRKRLGTDCHKGSNEEVSTQPSIAKVARNTQAEEATGFSILKPGFDSR